MRRVQISDQHRATTTIFSPRTLFHVFHPVGFQLGTDRNSIQASLPKHEQNPTQVVQIEVRAAGLFESHHKKPRLVERYKRSRSMTLNHLLKGSALSALVAALSFTALPAEAEAQSRKLETRGGERMHVDRPSRQAARSERRQSRSESRQQRQSNRGEARQERRGNRGEARQERRADRGETRQERRGNRGEARQTRRSDERSGRDWNRSERRADVANQRSTREWNRGDRRERRVENTQRNRSYTSRDRNRSYSDGRRDGRRSERRAERRDDRQIRRDSYRDGRRDGRRAERYRDRREDRNVRRTAYRNGYRDGNSHYYRDRRYYGRGKYRGNYRRWDRHNWRKHNRYNWHNYRRSHRSIFRLGRYYSPYRHHSYSRIRIGFFLDSLFFGSRYWINDPWEYRLPDVYGPYRWVRYYDDVLLVNIYTGETVDVIYDFFW